MTEDDVVSFITASIPSVWALETLLLLKRSAPDRKRVDQIVSSLRSSELAITQGLNRLEQAGLITQSEGSYEYRPASGLLASLADEIVRLYAMKPVWLMNVILNAKNENLQVFANSFRLKD